MTRRKKKPITPKSQIRAALRQLWLRSRERGAALKRANGQCFNCGSDFNLEVHHITPIEWDYLIELIRAEILTDQLLVCCQSCHAIITEGERRRSERIIRGLEVGLCAGCRNHLTNICHDCKNAEHWTCEPEGDA